MTTTQLKHTPAPWRIGNAGTMIFGPKTESPSPVSIAEIQNSNRTTREEKQANARLIACAPELLEALKHARVMLFELGAFKDVDENSTCKASTDLIDNIISKAEGNNI